MVLIVEDDAVSRRALQQLLRVNGFETTAASSAEEAERLISSGPVPDVALVDIILPGKNGFEFIGWLELHAPQASTVLITSESGGAIGKFRRDHSCLYLREPVDFQALLSALQNVDRGKLM